MKRYAVVGASSGTGTQIVDLLRARGDHVRAISRMPRPGEPGVEAFAADVTDPAQMRAALAGGFDAVFYTADIHGRGLTRDAVRAVMVDGCVNALAGAREGGAGRFILLSVIGPQRFSWVWWILGAMKPGMRRNIIERERTLQADALPYVICRAPRLTDAAAVPVAAAAASKRLDMASALPRASAAHALVAAADGAPANSVWDIFARRGEPLAPWLAVPSETAAANDEGGFQD